MIDPATTPSQHHTFDPREARRANARREMPVSLRRMPRRQTRPAAMARHPLRRTNTDETQGPD